MNIGVVYPPLSFPISPYLSISLLAGQLKSCGFNVNCIDLNAEFYSDILKKDVLKNSITKAEKYIREENANKPVTSFEHLSIEEKISYFKYLYIKSKLSNRKEYKKIIDNVEKSVSTLKNNKTFYNPDKFKESLLNIHSAVDLFFLPYAPAVSKYYKLKKKIFSLDWENIRFQTFSEAINPYIKYFSEKINNGDYDNYSIMYISVPFFEQLIPALTFSRLLKQKLSIKVVIGGNYITRIKDAFVKNKEIFETYIDGILLFDGENSVVEYSKFVKGELNIEEVSNLLYKDELGNIIQNKTAIYTDIENRNLQCFEGLDFNKYLTPEIFVSIQSSKGCYWNKCTFCDYSYGKPIFSSYSVEKFVLELEYYNKKMGIKCFEIVDEALNPIYFEKVADKIIEKNLDLNLYCYFRLEKVITSEMLHKFSRAGVVCIQWGYEAASGRIMKLMNKGIDVQNRLNILKMSSDALIWNRVFGLACFPSETDEELIQTLSVFDDNRDIIHSFIVYKFVLGRYSLIKEKYKDFGITSLYDESEYSAALSSDNIGYGELVKNFYSKIIQKNNFWLDVVPDEYLLFYLSYYGKEKLMKEIYSVQ